MINNKQFIISKTPYNRDDFNNISLQGGYILSYQKELSVSHNNDFSIILLGIAWQTSSNRQSPNEEINNINVSEIDDEMIFDMEEHWCGRYVLIVKDKIYTDATCLLNVFYSENSVASSIQLIHEVENLGDVKRLPFHMGSIQFMPGPCTMEQKIKRLLPSQIMNYVTGKVIQRPLLTQHYPNMSTEEIANRFIALSDHSLREMQKTVTGDLWLSFTGGKDSRAVLALLLHSGIEFKSFTFEYGTLPLEDLLLPPIIASKVNIPHVFIKRFNDKFDSNREQDYLTQCSGYSHGNVVHTYAYRQYEELIKLNGGPISVISGDHWEIYNDFFLGIAFETGEENIEEFLELNRKFIQCDELEEALRQYFSYASLYPQRWINKVNRFYWEQGCCAWNGAVVQGTDLVNDLYRVIPINSRAFFNLLFSLTDDMRKDRKFEEYITSKLCPEIKDIGYRFPVGWKEGMEYFPYYLVDLGAKILIYGAGVWGRKYVRRIQRDGVLTILGVIDRNGDRIASCSGVPVYKPDQINGFEYDFVLIALENPTAAFEAKESLKRIGVPENKIKYRQPLCV